MKVDKCGLLGEKLSHSFSPMIHSELGGYEYKLYEKTPEELDAFLRHGDFDGLNVTIPYKQAVMPYLAELSDVARATGSVNTIVRRGDGMLVGDNTDVFGFAYLLGKSGVDVRSGKTIVLGSGGSSLAAQTVLRERGAKEVVVVSRSGDVRYEDLDGYTDAVLIVNTTPVGMYPNNGMSPLEGLERFGGCQAVTDLIYNPARTALLLQAEDLGILALNGLSMLVAQAKRAAECFTGQSIPDEKIEAIASKIEKKTRNIILIGMPGCGKSSIGRSLAHRMERKFVDIDAEIVERAGKPIPVIFETDGEEAFRVLESEVLRSVCSRSGLVVATGGGVVTREENRHVLRQNSVTVFVERDVEALATRERPLSARDGVSKLAEERLPLYKAWSDYIVENRGVQETAREIELVVSS